MATRSYIGIMDKDGVGAHVIYCHWDGYPEWVGMVLKKFYDTEEKARALLELGDLSSLGETLETTESYARDRGEEPSPARYCANKEQLFGAARGCWAEYVYLFNPELARWECMATIRDEGFREIAL